MKGGPLLIKVKTSGNFSSMQKFLKRANLIRVEKILNRYGRYGCQQLAAATPVDSGKTAASWTYEVVQKDGAYDLVFLNTNTNKYVNIAIILQTGHATGTGGYVKGQDYINPVLKPIFDALADQVWKEVTGYGTFY